MNPIQSVAFTADVAKQSRVRFPASPLTTEVPHRAPVRDRQLLNIMSVSTADYGGGAEKIGANLYEAYASRGHRSWLAVGHKRGDDADVLHIPNETDRGTWGDFWWRLHDGLEQYRGSIPAAGRIRRVFRDLAGVGKNISASIGLEAMGYPASTRLLNLITETPDILHLHNMHGSYFDLRSISSFSKSLPTVLTLHDMWMLTGHCAYTLGCDRWKTGCGSCPDLSIYPAIKRDATAMNWRRKQKIYSRSRLYVATPSQWLMRNVEESMFMSGIVEARVIPNGVNREHFHPGDRQLSRAKLNIPQDAKVLLFVANGVRQNMFKDYNTLQDAVERIAVQQGDNRIIFVTLGEVDKTEKIGSVEIRHVAYRRNAEEVALHFQAADIYLHAAKDDNFPNTVLEALACGTPVVATAVGGIPEQIRGLYQTGINDLQLNTYGADAATGVLVAPGDSSTIAAAVVDLLADPQRLQQLSLNASRDAAVRFDMERQVDIYIDWFHQILEETAADFKKT